jgi:hypothetical protein
MIQHQAKIMSQQITWMNNQHQKPKTFMKSSQSYIITWRGVRVVEGAALEKRLTKVSWVRIPSSPPVIRV